MRLLDPRNGPAFDLPPWDGPPRTWVVASLPRTGSTLLCNALWDTGRVGAPKEYLNPMQVRDWEARLAPDRWTRGRHRALVGPAVALAGRGRWSDARLRAYLDRVRAHRTGPTGWFGLKIHWHHFEAWFLARGRSPEAFLGPARWLRVVRRDRLRQAVSWARALQTGRWASWQRGYSPPRFSARAIEARLAAIDAGESAWDAWFAGQGLRPRVVVYEDLIADWEGTLRAVLADLDVPPEAQGALPAPSLRRQADDTTDRWIERWRAREGTIRS